MAGLVPCTSLLPPHSSNETDTELGSLSAGPEGRSCGSSQPSCHSSSQRGKCLLSWQPGTRGTGTGWAPAAHHHLLPSKGHSRAREKGEGLSGFRGLCPPHLAAQGHAELQLCLALSTARGDQPHTNTCSSSLLGWGQPLRAVGSSWAGGWAAPAPLGLQACAVAAPTEWLPKNLLNSHLGLTHYPVKILAFQMIHTCFSYKNGGV